VLISLIVNALTVFAALVVVVTRFRLAGERTAAGTYRMSRDLVSAHTAAGVLGLVIWLVFLVAGPKTAAGSSVVGIVGLFFWWVTVIAGVMALTSWLPARGRHASGAARRARGSGLGLALLAHLGLLASVCVFTGAYLVQAV
jgi:hypothetical protein